MRLQGKTGGGQNGAAVGDYSVTAQRREKLYTDRFQIRKLALLMTKANKVSLLRPWCYRSVLCAGGGVRAGREAMWSTEPPRQRRLPGAGLSCPRERTTTAVVTNPAGLKLVP